MHIPTLNSGSRSILATNLGFKHGIIKALFAQQLRMSSRFDGSSTMHDRDMVRVQDARQLMSNDQNGQSKQLAQIKDIVKDMGFGSVIQGARCFV